MFGVDFSEIALIFLIALVVLGPAKLPQVAATVGRWIGRARVMARQFREQLEQEANTLKDAADLRSRPAPPPSPRPPATALSADAASPEAASPPAAPPASPPAAPSVAAEDAPSHLDHPAPPPAEPHERGA